MYTLKKDTKIDNDVILNAIKEIERRKTRMDKLEKYYFGEHAILERTRASDDIINNLLVTNHAKYITDTNVGYLMGNPVEYQVDVDGVSIDGVVDAYKNQTIADLDAEIAKDLSIFGLQYEYLYSTEKNEPKSANIDNRTAMIVYDSTLEHNKMFALMYRPIFKGNETSPESYEVVVADTTNVTEYTLGNKEGGQLTETTPAKPHGFGEVPMIEYKNNSDFTGDFESVLTLIDAYNVLQSDRMNDKEQLVDAILAFYGASVTPEQIDDLREKRVISGIPADAKVEYITKGLNEAEADALRKTIETDIHKISMTPNMSDHEFVGNSSGVAIRYKLLAFEQNIKTKERFLEKGLMQRFAMYWNYLKATSKGGLKGELKITDLDVVFKRNLPSNDLETSTIITNLDGKVSNETLVGQLSFVKDAKEEIKQAKKEAEERQAQVAKAFAETDIPTTQSTDPNAPNYVDPTKSGGVKPPVPAPVKPTPVKKV